MKKVLIISSHFPPSNLASVHRARLFAQHLPSFNWEPFVLTVHEKYYEEPPDFNLLKLLPSDLKVFKANALPLFKPRLLGDTGLRSFFYLYLKAKSIIRNEKIDFIYILIPSFYLSLLGRLLKYSTGIKYGIDYIDPWVHHFPGTENIFSRHWFSTKLASILEPIAVKHVKLITGVAPGYYSAIFERNPHLKNIAIAGAMPYGGEETDFNAIKNLAIKTLFEPNPQKFQFVYAGAMLPKAYSLIDCIFETIKENASLFENTEFHFIGTGKTPSDSKGYNIKPYAEKHGLWETTVFEYPKRLPYLEVLNHLCMANAVFILGSTEPHYTPSKVYQGILSGKPILSILHEESTAVKVLRESKGGLVLTFAGEKEILHLKFKFIEIFREFNLFASTFLREQVNIKVFDDFSAKAVTKQLAGLFDNAIE